MNLRNESTIFLPEGNESVSNKVCCYQLSWILQTDNLRPDEQVFALLAKPKRCSQKIVHFFFSYTSNGFINSSFKSVKEFLKSLLQT